MPHDELENCKELTVVVRTMPVNQSCDSTIKELDKLYHCEEKQLNKMSENFCKKMQDAPILDSGNGENVSDCKYEDMNTERECACLDKTKVESCGVVAPWSKENQPERERLCSSNNYDESSVITNENSCCKNSKHESDIQLFISDVSSHIVEHFILDIDMDFFSTLNPFKAMFSKVCMPIVTLGISFSFSV